MDASKWAPVHWDFRKRFVEASDSATGNILVVMHTRRSAALQRPPQLQCSGPRGLPRRTIGQHGAHALHTGLRTELTRSKTAMVCMRWTTSVACAQHMCSASSFRKTREHMQQRAIKHSRALVQRRANKWQEKGTALARIRTAVDGFKVRRDNHYTTRAPWQSIETTHAPSGTSRWIYWYRRGSVTAQAGVVHDCRTRCVTAVVRFAQLASGCSRR